MATRKPISINLRDLQRVLNEGKPELPRYSSGALDDEDDEVEGSGRSLFGGTRFRSGDSRWANEDDDDGYDGKSQRGDRDEQPEPDFSTVRNTDNEFKRSEVPTQSLGRGNSIHNSEHRMNDDDDDDDVWRSRDVRSNRNAAPDDDDDVWRRPGTTTKDSGASAGQSRQNDVFGREVDNDEDNMFNRAAMRSDAQNKKRYVPPSKKNETDSSGSGTARNDRFSCLEETYERRNSNSNEYDSSRAREVFSMQRREPESQREYQGGQHQQQNTRESYNDHSRDNTRPNPFGESHKTGVYVPSFKRSQTYQSTQTQKSGSVHDIFLKAAGISDNKPKDENKRVQEPESPKVTQSQVDLQLQQKREAVLRHNRMYEVNLDTLKTVEDAVVSLLNGNDVTISDIVPEDEQELVPAVVTCMLACKACEGCSTIQDVHGKFTRVAPLLKALCERCEDPMEEKLLTEVAKIVCHWKLPALSESVYLIEAVFDALLQCGVVTREDVLHWFENTADEVPDRINVILQLLPWKKWLIGESLQTPPEPSEHESEESEEDIDIEALVPKPIRLTKTLLY